jgi:phenylpropionate dioxygenase-like ring-hydroxylating dioxygenase large terminal subunit
MDKHFADFANVWTPVALASELGTVRPLAVQVAGVGLALFRGEGGKAAALRDRCIHRGVALSLGRVEAQCLECPFHGWRYAADGRVTNVPWNPDAKLPTLRTRAVPTRELGGLIFVYTSFDSEPTDEPQMHEWFSDPGMRVAGVAVDWNVHWTRAMENMLDSPHLPFVHASTIGRGLRCEVGGRMDIDTEDQPWGFRSRMRVDGEPRPGMLDFRWPNQMNLHLDFRKRRMLLMTACVPIDSERTRMLLVGARDFLRWPIFDRLFNRANLRIANQDKAIIESSQPSRVPDAREEKSVRTDAPVLRFRKLYFERLAVPSVGTPES